LIPPDWDFAEAHSKAHNVSPEFDKTIILTEDIEL